MYLNKLRLWTTALIGGLLLINLLFSWFQPPSIVSDEICTACDFNRPGKNCLRKLEWVWRGEAYMAKRRFTFLLFLYTLLILCVIIQDNAVHNFFLSFSSLVINLKYQWLSLLKEATWVRFCWKCRWEIVKIFPWIAQSGATSKTERASEEILPKGKCSFSYCATSSRLIHDQCKCFKFTFLLQAYKRVLDKPVTELREAGICMRENSFYVDTVRRYDFVQVIYEYLFYIFYFTV